MLLVIKQLQFILFSGRVYVRALIQQTSHTKLSFSLPIFHYISYHVMHLSALPATSRTPRYRMGVLCHLRWQRVRRRLIRLLRSYNFLLFHAIIYSVLDVQWALLYTFILFLGLTY